MLAGISLLDAELVQTWERHERAKSAPPDISYDIIRNISLDSFVYVRNSDGEWAILAGTDGACADPTIPYLARASYGVYFAREHPLNDFGPSWLEDTARAGEVLAFYRLLGCARYLDYPIYVIIDSEYVIG